MASQLTSAADGSLACSIRAQARVIGALLMREILTRYGRHNIGFAWLFAEPMLFTLGIAVLWSMANITHGSSLSIVAFAVTGYSSVLMWRNAASRCAKAIEANWALLYHRNVTVLDIFLSRIVLEIVGATASFMALAALFIFAGQMDWPDDPLRVVSAWLLLAWFALSFGLTIGGLSERSDVFERVWHVMAYLLFPLSGAVFMVDWLPAMAQEIVLWLPMVHAVEMLRHGWFGGAVPTHEDAAFLAASNLVLMFIGLMLARDAERRVEPQ